MGCKCENNKCTADCSNNNANCNDNVECITKKEGFKQLPQPVQSSKRYSVKYFEFKQTGGSNTNLSNWIHQEENGPVFYYNQIVKVYGNPDILVNKPRGLCIWNIDKDDDLEILIGSTNSLVSIDIKESGTSDNYWNVHRGNIKRNGYYEIFSNECAVDLGDVNGDETINILDVVQVANLILELAIPTYECAADFNEDYLVNILDLVQIANYILDN